MLQKEIKKLKTEIASEMSRKERRDGIILDLQKQLQNNLSTLNHDPEKVDVNAFLRKINNDKLEIQRLQNEIALLNKNIEKATKELELKETQLAVKLIIKIHKTPFIFLCNKDRKNNSIDRQESHNYEILFIPKAKEFKK
jgi:hypothetical protein